VETANSRNDLIMGGGEEMEKSSKDSHRRDLSVGEEVWTARVRAGPREGWGNG